MIPVVALNGPTASGKTAAAVALAQLLATRSLPAEIINADAMLVYRGMDIGTAKPTVGERGGIRHHLLDLMDVTETANVAGFQTMARDAIADCQSRGVIPLLTGGSPLYVHAILDNFDFPGTDPAIRDRLEAELATGGPGPLYQRLRELSPDAAVGIMPTNGRRIVRALEVIELTGSFTSVLPSWEYALVGVMQFGFEVPRELLDERIAARVGKMWRDGLVAEVAELSNRGLRHGRTASRAIGYRQVLAYLDGDMTEAEAQAAIVTATRRLSRKQLGWFRRDPRIVWVPADADGLAQIADAITAKVRSNTDRIIEGECPPGQET